MDSRIESMVTDHQDTLYGSHGSPGIAYKVGIMWRAHVWVLCSLSALVSALFTTGIYHFFHVIP